jgi:hypothetical protein
MKNIASKSHQKKARLELYKKLDAAEGRRRDLLWSEWIFLKQLHNPGSFQLVEPSVTLKDAHNIYLNDT